MMKNRTNRTQCVTHLTAYSSNLVVSNSSLYLEKTKSIVVCCNYWLMTKRINSLLIPRLIVWHGGRQKKMIRRIIKGEKTCFLIQKKVRTSVDCINRKRLAHQRTQSTKMNYTNSIIMCYKRENLSAYSNTIEQLGIGKKRILWILMKINL